jgi:hypothetical protein
MTPQAGEFDFPIVLGLAAPSRQSLSKIANLLI